MHAGTVGDAAMPRVLGSAAASDACAGTVGGKEVDGVVEWNIPQIRSVTDEKTRVSGVNVLVVGLL